MKIQLVTDNILIRNTHELIQEKNILTVQAIRLHTDKSQVFIP